MKTLYAITGKVRRGKKRGKRLGFPTANISLDKNIEEGVYISLTTIDGRDYQSISFIGSPKTFAESDYKAESHILNFRENIYGKIITIKLYKKLRDNKKFASEKELAEQIKNDIKKTRIFYSIP